MSRGFQTLVLAAILLLALLAYAPSLGYPYVQDARIAVEHNPVVARGDLAEIFGSDYWKDTASPAHTLYRPITVLGFALEVALAGEPSPRLSHLVNLLLHACVAALLFVYASRLRFPAAAAVLAALLFTVHPVLMQPVAGVAGRPDLQATLFSLVALLFASRAGPWRGLPLPSSARRRVAAWGAGVALFLALGSKESAVATPALLMAQEWLMRPAAAGKRDRVERAAALAPSALALFTWLLLRARAIGEWIGSQPVLPMDNVLSGLDGLPRVATTLGMAGRYAALLLWPRRLSGDYSGTVIDAEPSLLGLWPLAGLLWALLLGALVLAPRSPWPPLRREGAGLSMAALLFVLPYLVVGNVLVLNGAGFAERLIYFPALGFCLLAGRGLAAAGDGLAVRLGESARKVLLGALALLLAALALHARGEARMWAGDEALFERTLAARPESLRAHFALARLRLEAGRLDEALALYDRAIELVPEHGPLWGWKGAVHLRRDELGEAEAALARCVELRPDLAEPRMMLGMARERRGDLERAASDLEQALLLDPDLEEARHRLAPVLTRLGLVRGRGNDLVGAERALRRATELRPLIAEPWMLLGNALAAQRRFDEAEAALRRALELDPDMLDAEERLAHVLYDQGRFAEAAERYRRCVGSGREGLRGRLAEAERRAAGG